MRSSHILITGGAGFIGSHIVKMLALSGYRPVIFDNLSTGNPKAISRGHLIEGDLANLQDLEHVFRSEDFSAVMHFAASIDVGESVTDPAKYYMNNVVNTLNLLETMRRFHVKTFIFSSTAAIFGEPQQGIINENHPKTPINPYGNTKLIVETLLSDYDSAYGIKSSCLRYFNAAGGDPEGEIKNYQKKKSNLIPLVLQSLKHNTPLTIFGCDYPTADGTCIRDYIHIEDLGSAHLLAMEKLFQDHCSTQYNLGTGKGFSVKEVIRAAEEVTGLKVTIMEGPRRAGDPPLLVADSQKAKKELGWSPRYSELKTMIAHAWQALI